MFFMLIGLVGAPNSGKSSFFKAATMIDVKIASYPFTTIEPNHGIAYVTAKCPCTELKTKCEPQNSLCMNGTRLVPIELLDVAGLVPGSHAGRGRGNQFLNNLIRGDLLVHIVDSSGLTDSEGNPASGYNPCETVRFLENEIDLWFVSVIRRNLEKIKDKSKAGEILAGIGVKKEHVDSALPEAGLNPEILAKELRKISKPMIIVANKIDLAESEANLDKIKKTFPNLTIIPCSAEAEIALRTAAKAGVIEYVSGESDFKILKSVTNQQKSALEFIRENVLKKFGSTGVQNCLNAAVFDFLAYRTVYPVENVAALSDKKGRVLPDAHLMPSGSTARDLAYKIHTDIGKTFLYAVDCRTKKRIGADHLLQDSDIISVVSTAK